MKFPSLRVIAFVPALALIVSAAEPSSTDSSTDAKKKETAPSVGTAPKTTQPQGPNPAPVASADTANGTPQPPKEPTTLLPPVEVNKSRITNLDLQINEQQRAIDREKQQTKPTKLDTALNDSKVSKALSFLGGASADERSNLAKERVSLLEEEKEILESMKTTQSREEKDELQKELEIIRATRRELETGPK